ncbi:MAG: hypothetical protein ACK2T3_14320 [Candidatus Promineifilaceae bacterium]|jgi:nucleotide-binding universal stress UspA family protein
MKDYYSAAQDFKKARNRAVFQELIARFTGQPTELLSYEEVRQQVRASGITSKTIQEVPLDAIVGSVGRYTDFTRSFLPKRSSDADRWARIMVATEDLSGLPPVELILVDQVYFVVDGHHRVSVANEIGANTIEAYVTEIRTSIPLSTDESREDLIRKAEYADFMKETQLEQTRPEADLYLSEAGLYGVLLDHISVHRYFMGIEQEREIPYTEAAQHWYDFVYLPVVLIARDVGVLDNFPNRTVADLYLWISKHRSELAEMIEWEVDYSHAAADIAQNKESSWWRRVTGLGQRVIDVVSSDEDTSLTKAEEHLLPTTASVERPLFMDLLVPVSGMEIGWIALDSALEVAVREGGRILGLHVQIEGAELNEDEIQEIAAGFDWRCGERNIDGKIVFATGAIANEICERSRWVDLVVVKLQYPPGSSALARYSSGIARIIRTCTRPLLVVSGELRSLTKPLLLWEGRKRSGLAAMIAAYVSCKWAKPLVVLANDGKNQMKRTKLKKLRSYLGQYDVESTYTRGPMDDTDSILEIAAREGCDWIITAGYGSGTIRGIIFGELLDELLRKTDLPTMIAR